MDQRKPKGKRSRTRICFFALILLAVAGIAYWQLSMRLSSVERRLVGTWRDINGQTITLTEGRGWYRKGQRHGGRWYVSEDRLYHPESVPREAYSRIRSLVKNQALADDAYVLKFIDDDRLSIIDALNGQSYEWERVRRRSWP